MTRVLRKEFAMSKRWFLKLCALAGLSALVPKRLAAQSLTDAQKIAFADMELRGFRDLGLDSTIVQRIVNWYKLGNTAEARAMIGELYKLRTGKASITAVDWHQISHWVEEHSAGDGRNFQ